MTFPKSYTCSQLSWSHYRLLMRVENENARQFYMDEAVKSNYSVRQLATTSDKTTSDFSLCNRPDGSVVYP